MPGLCSTCPGRAVVGSGSSCVQKEGQQVFPSGEPAEAAGGVSRRLGADVPDICMPTSPNASSRSPQGLQNPDDPSLDYLNTNCLTSEVANPFIINSLTNQGSKVGRAPGALPTPPARICSQNRGRNGGAGSQWCWSKSATTPCLPVNSQAAHEGVRTHGTKPGPY